MFKKINYLSVTWIVPLIFIVILVALRFNFHYLVFHSIVEYFAVFVSLAITLVTYYTFAFTKNRYLLFIGLAYFWVAILDVMHVQTYIGMNLYDVQDSNTSITFWIFARTLETTSLLIAPFMRHVEYKKNQITFLFFVITSAMVLIAMNSPLALFTPDSGLTPLKIFLEYLIIIILLLALYVNKKREREFSTVINKAMTYSIVMTILAEISFTLYLDIYGIMNVIGHIFKFLSFWILLHAIIKTSLEEPFKVMEQGSTTYDAMPYPAIVVDKEGIIRQVNKAGCAIIKKETSDIVGYSNHILYHPKSLNEKFCPVCIAIAQGKELQNCELVDEDLDTVKQYSLSSIKRKENDVQGMVQVSVDVTHSKKLENSLLNQYQLLQNIIDTIPMGIFWKDKDGVYLGSNELFLKDAQLSTSDELIGKNDFELHWGDKAAQLFRADDALVIKSGKSKLKFEEQITNSDAQTVFVSTSKVPIRNISGDIIGVLGAYEDITQKKEIEQQLEKQREILKYQAHYDMLTQLPNRTLLQDRLTHAIEKAKRNNEEFALFFIDLDQFKQINDTLGHQTGDEILKMFAKRLKNSIREEDTLSRLGGDEFTILLENTQSIEHVSNIAQKIINQSMKAFSVNKNDLYVTVSIGISVYPRDSNDINDLLKYADSAMYKAKDNGRNNFQFYSSDLTQKVTQKALMQNDLRKALKNKEFEAYYQPQIRASDTKEVLCGVEALVRWKHPTLGMISPVEFIPLAEETGMIVELDRLVMRMAITQMANWYEEGLNPGTLSLNLAMKQLQQEDFIHTVEKIIQDSGCQDKRRISFEITESDLMTNPEASIEKLNILKELGIEISIDDFGTGYSSLSYLKRLPVGKLKIDQSFTSGVPTDKDDAAIVKAIISLAKNLNLKIIAEGVETQEQKEFMLQHGCDEFQGYLYSKPLSSEKMREFIISFNKQ